MVRDDLCITVPSYFRCPISWDLMESPVSLCTGVTYDRSSIQRWLDAGNNTCPATMQVLHTKELVPNHTLRRLIKIWSDSSAATTRRPPSPSPPPDSLSSDQASRLIAQLEGDLENDSSAVRKCFARLIPFAAESEENGRLLTAAGGRILPPAVALVGRVKDLVFLEEIVSFCNVLLRNWMNNDSVEQKTAMKSKIEAETDSSPLSEGDEIYSELLRLISASDYNPEAMDAALTFLIRLSLQKRNRAKFIRAGGVNVLAAALADAELTAPLTEKVLQLLEMASGSSDGRNQICGSEICVRAIVKKLLKVSSAATEHAVRVLWSICYLFGEKKAAAAVAESNGMAKILVVLQSNCSPAVRQMCVDLLRVFRCSSKSSCVSWYDTKTTHIMPF
ncbi:U-box domain-containing protein 27 [Andrographis paniculata]|uniref:U-box domain-containing protein 27 n=1 Tax=Andrographis paniculata TaxID=175694 RepID=UPI0021E80B15|nr:U-box domain-containing protein 27 [Andrographis paniculata]